MPLSVYSCVHAHLPYMQWTGRRWLMTQSLENIVPRELGAPYMVQHLPDTGQIVLTPVAGGGGGANPTAPSLWEKTVAVVWRIPSLHLLRTEAQYLTLSPT